jgi:metal-responsive CopG/Arc/MetJ family transcriptional regulator
MKSPLNAESEETSEQKIRVSIELSKDHLCMIEAFREELGLKSRSEVISLILEEILRSGGEERT